MKELCAWLLAAVMLAFALRYVYQIRKGEIKPTLSTWIIFFLGTGLSLTTYAIAEHHDFYSGILNTMDIGTVTVVLIAAIVWGKREVRFRTFDKWYLVGIGLIIGYGLLFGDAWGSNIFTQGLISLGYVPTIQYLIAEKRNTESFTSWSLALIAGVLGLYPAIIDGNLLAVIYACRTIVLVSLFMGVMAYYHFRQHHKSR